MNEINKPKETDTAITEEMKLSFFKAFLSDTPYERTYSLFDNQFTVTFKTMTAKQMRDVFDQLRQSQINDELTNDPNYLVTLTSYRLAVSLASVNNVPFGTAIDEDTYVPADQFDSYIKAKAALLKTWPIFKLGAITEAFRSFEKEVVTLTEAVQTQNFWKAVK